MIPLHQRMCGFDPDEGVLGPTTLAGAQPLDLAYVLHIYILFSGSLKSTFQLETHSVLVLGKVCKDLLP